MKKLVYLLVILSVVLSACGAASTPAATPTSPAAPATPADTPTPAPTSTPLPTDTPVPSPTPAYPPEGYGPTNFPAGVDPLTGLKVALPALLDRRPMIVKVPNLPRNVRPQWGISLADIVFEYYTEEGTTRLAALFYGNDASMVGPIRSARLFDANIVRGYKAIFAFVGFDLSVGPRFLESEFVDRLVTEAPGAPIKRYEPNGADFAVVSTSDLSAYATKKGIANSRQDLSGMFFNLSEPAGGQPVTQVYVRYSNAVYNRWDYDPASGKYLRFADTADASIGIQGEQYGQLTDRLTNQPIAFDNLIVLNVIHDVFKTDSKGDRIYDILLSGSGDAYAFRDGQAYQVKWHRNDTDVVSLTNPDGSPFAFKPGTTWFEVVSTTATLAQADQSWRFTQVLP